MTRFKIITLYSRARIIFANPAPCAAQAAGVGEIHAARASRAPRVGRTRPLELPGPRARGPAPTKFAENRTFGSKMANLSAFWAPAMPQKLLYRQNAPQTRTFVDKFPKFTDKTDQKPASLSINHFLQKINSRTRGKICCLSTKQQIFRQYCR